MRGGNHLAMKSLVQLFNEWEIQLLVLLSFTLQFFLFFAGGLRRHTRCSILRSLIWLAYLGADLVAAYVLGLISRQEVSTHHLSFLWAPFLLIHLGGQDTITAFAIEDNKLWGRHLLNLVVQVSLTLYIFWKSFDGGPNMQLLAPSILLFVTGTIKYGERTWALWCGNLRNIRDSDPIVYLSETRIDTSSDPVFSAFPSISAMHCYFTGIPKSSGWVRHSLCPEFSTKLFRILEIQLGLMYDDIYTKALVLRTWDCTILRCISHLSFLAAFGLFFSVVRNKKEERWYYNSVDTAITYGLFLGGFSLEVSSVCIIMMSPWTWAWLQQNTRHCSFLGSIIARCTRKRRVLWSNSMGQYNMLDYLGQYDRKSSKMMAVIRNLANAFCRTKKKFWISKLVDTKFVDMDEHIMKCVVQRICQHGQEYAIHGGYTFNPQAQPQQWPNLGPHLQKMVQVEERYSSIDLDSIISLHLFTEVQLSRYARTTVESESSYALVRVCRMMSHYMVYLLVKHPEMLPILDSGQAGPSAVSQCCEELEGADVNSILRQAVLFFNENRLPEPPEECTEAHLLEIRDAWVGVLLHAASKSRPEIHAALLATGGEPLTFIWLLMAYFGLGDVRGNPIEMTNSPTIGPRYYAFCFPPQPQASGSAEVPVPI